jgi:3-oxoacyl-(acyl-carrier-protein) synthase
VRDVVDAARDLRVRVSGAGVVCALGVGASSVCEAVSRNAVAPFVGRRADRPAFPSPFDPARDLPPGRAARLGRQLAMTLAAVLDAVGARRAWEEDPAETGLVAATAHGPIHETVDFIAGVVRHGPRYASPLLFSGAQHNAMVGLVARELGIRGPAMVVSNGEISFETALLAAVAGLRAGRMRRAIVVGADAFQPTYAASLDCFGLLSSSPEAPDPTMRRTTRGFHLGEGAGALVLERGDPGAGVSLDRVALGAAASSLEAAPDRVEVLGTGDSDSVRRHRAALAAPSIDSRKAEIAWPAARYGAFASLSAVAIAAEAARRLASGPDSSATLFLAAPRDTSPASVILSGGGR